MKAVGFLVNGFAVLVPYPGKDRFITSFASACATPNRDFHLSEHREQISCSPPVSGAAWTNLIN
ncbi:hypothetical protein PQR70_19455 [Paraburkholderia madseniana]|uniref:hypothetical protein n=1 Tax=Paraburkholderia madseniana TaxID=2599607 RepID=UPI0038BD1097